MGVYVPKFTKLNPDEVHIGRGRESAQLRQLYVQAIKSSDAGRIELGRGERPGTAKRLLAEASKAAGSKVRSTWDDSRQRVLLWKRTGLR